MRLKALALFIAMSFSACVYAGAEESIILTPNNAVFLTEQITPPVLTSVTHKLQTNPNLKYLVIYSHGGYLEGNSAFAAKVSSFPKVKVIVIHAASAAAGIVQMVSNERLMVRNGTMLFHRVRHGWDDNEEVQVWEQRLLHMKQADEQFAKICRKRLKVTKEEYDKKTIGRDWVLNRSEALKVGAVDRGVNVKCNADLASDKMTVDVIDFINADIMKQELCMILEEAI